MRFPASPADHRRRRRPRLSTVHVVGLKIGV
jgi:hypothetical protein